MEGHAAAARKPAQQRRIRMRNQHHLARPRLRQAILPKRATRAIAGLRTIVAPPLRVPPGAQCLAARTLHHVVPRMAPARAQQRRIRMRNQHHLARPRLRQAILAQRAARAIAGLRTIVAPRSASRRGLSVLPARTLHHVVPRVVAPREFAYRIHLGFDTFRSFTVPRVTETSSTTPRASSTTACCS